jgi:DNA primase
MLLTWCAIRRASLKAGELQIDRRKAALRIAEWYGIGSERPTPASGRKAVAPSETGEGARRVESEPVREEASGATGAGERATPVNPPLTFELKNLDADHPYLRERSLTEETIATFGLGYFGGRGTMHGRIVIPIHDATGQLIAYAGRWPGDPPEGEPKYKLPANFHKSLVLYNFHRAREYTDEGLIVVEGFFTVFELWQKSRRNVVAVMGNSMSAEQERLIVETVGSKGKVLFAFDPDEAGRRGMLDAAARLAPRVFVRTVAFSI